jgi:hypothetical protein
MLGGRPPNGIIVPCWPVMKPQQKGTVRMQATTIGWDLAKNIFHVCGEDAQGRSVLSRQLGRARV